MKRLSTTSVVTLCLALAFAFTGCMKNQYTIGSGSPTDGPPDSSRWNAHWLFGLVGEDNAEVAKICPSGNATIKERTTFVNGLIGALVGVIYKPTTVQIWCSGGSTAQLELSPEDLRRAALTPEASALAHAESDELGARLDASKAQYLAAP